MQSEQTRQRKRERKRLRRVEKRRVVDSVPALGPLLAPCPKMSDTLMAFARPLLHVLPADAGLGTLKRSLLLAAAVWNAVVDAEGDFRRAAVTLVTDLRSKLDTPLPQAVIELLAERKVRRFGDDSRRVRSVDVSWDGDRLRVAATSTLQAIGSSRCGASSRGQAPS